MSKTTIKTYPNIAQSFGIIGVLILGSIIMIPLNLLLNIIISGEASMLSCFLLINLISLLIVNSIRKNKTGISSFYFDINHKIIIPFIILGTLALQYGIVYPISALIPMSEFFRKVFMALGAHKSIYTFMLIVVAAPILEELIFRGIILDGLLKKYTPHKSILVSSLLFGLAHLNPWQFVTGFLLGIFSGWIYFNTKSVFPSIIIHATANLNAFIMMHFINPNASMNETLIEMYGGITNLTIAIIGSVIILIVCFYFINREFVKDDSIKPPTLSN